MFGLGKRRTDGPYTLFVEKNGCMKQQGEPFSDAYDAEEAAEDWLTEFPAIEIVKGNGERIRVTREQCKRDRGVYIPPAGGAPFIPMLERQGPSGAER